ncbi:MAG: hypothetical protein JOZ48_06495 [Acidobacteriaceae bacterium]|nr:hypothetical protein [Acidobacteriaceae bacterium]
MRDFYQWILAVHPRAFRERFGSEMLCVFDEALATEGAFRLMTDGALSVLRQRLFRRGPARKVLQVTPAGPSNLFSSAVGEQHPIPMKISHLIFGAAISLNLFVITCALIGRGHVLRRDTNPSTSGGSLQIFRSRMRSGNTLYLRGQSKVFPFVLFSQGSADADAGNVQPGSNSLMWVNIPFESSNGREIIYVRMTREQFARFEKAGTASVGLTSAKGEMQHAYLQIADVTDSKLKNRWLESLTQSDGSQDRGAGEANGTAAVSATPMVAVLVETETQNATKRSPSVQFVQVASNVKLEVLDWRGTGRPVCCLPGWVAPPTGSTSLHAS